MVEYQLQYTASEINERLGTVKDLEKLLDLVIIEDTNGDLILEFSSIDGNDIYD